jgi:Asp-tRNA(Asn)/Glu-tRNA(Gln) amidotransferase A subunit family amidase
LVGEVKETEGDPDVSEDRTKGREGRMGRRAVLKSIVAAGVAGPAAVAAAPAPSPAEPDISTADLAAADRLAGRSYSESERQLMARRAARTRSGLRAVRAYPLDELSAPATTFDPCLPGTSVPRGKSSFRLSPGTPIRYPGDSEALAFATAVDLSRLLKARKISSTALTRMYLARLKRLGPRLNCVVTLTEELALEQSARADREIAAGHYRGPLHGIPWGAKDLLATRGIRTTWGAKPFEHQVFDYDATVVQRLAEAGTVLVAKLSMGELAQGDLWFGGLTRNPWRPEQGSSGSSAGPGSATAAGLVGFAIGTETLGSIVSPSVRNGVTGLRPTFGRVSRHGAMALSWTMDKIGPMCRGVEDCALVLSAIHGPDGHDDTVADVPFRWDPTLSLAKLRVGIDAAAFAQVEKDNARRATYAQVLEVLRKLGITLLPVTLPPQTEAFAALTGLMIDVEAAASFARLTTSGQLDLLARQTENAWPNTFRVGSTVPAADYLQALRVRRQLQHQMAAALHDVDLYVTVPFIGPSLSYTNLTGHPSLITRCGTRDGQPESIEFIGGLYQEAAMLRVALAYEQSTDWHTRWPDTTKIPALSE